MSTGNESTPEARPPSSPPRKHRGRWLLWGLLGLLGLVLVLVAGALIYLTGPAGEARLQALVVQQANEQLSGKLEVGGLDLGLRSVVLTGLKLYDPEGELVAEVDRVEARLALAPLLRKHVVLSSARVEQPHLYLHQDERGLNLSRAIEPRQPKPEDPNAPRGTLRFTLEELQLVDGSVDYVMQSPEGNREVRLDDLDASGAASWASATEALDAKLDATASLGRPVAGPVRLALKAWGEEGKLNADVDMSAPGLGLRATGALEGEKQARVEVKQLTLAPETARAVLPSYPVAAPVTLSGTVAQAGNTVRVDLDAQAADGTAEVEGALDIEQLRTDGLTARVRQLDLARLLGGGPSTVLAADLHVTGGGKSLDTLDGTVDLTMPPSQVGGRTLGPVELHANAKQGRFELSQLQAQAPGASLTARGGGTQEDMRLEGRLVASDLDTFANTVGRLGDNQPLPLSGRGALDFTVSGPVRHPAASLKGGFDTLAWAETSVEGLTLDARVPDVTQPLTTDATLKATKLSAGGRTYEDLNASLVTRGRALEATVSTGGSTDLLVSLKGTVDKDNQGLGLDALTLRYPEAGWALQRPTHLGWGNGRVEVATEKEPLTLTSGPQSLSLALQMEGERINARTDLREFDLGRLPKAFLPETLDVDGQLSGSVAVSGRMARPDAIVDLTLRGGRYQQYEDLGFDLQGRYVRDRATGTFAANAPAGRVSAKYDVPVQALMQHRREPVDLELTLDHVDIGPALRMAGQPESATGLLSGSMTLKGMANDPRLQLSLKGSGLRYWGVPPQQPPPVVLAPGSLPPKLRGEPLGFELTARSDDKDGTLSASLDLHGIGSRATASLATPFTLGQLLTSPPTAAQVLETPMRELRAELSELPLGLLSQLGLAERAGGMLSMTASLTGPLLAPVGEVKMEARRATVNGLHPLDGNLALNTDKDSVKLQLVARRESTLLAQVDAHVEAPIAALQDQEVVGHVPFTLALRAGPISQRELMGLAESSGSLNRAGTVCRTEDEDSRSSDIQNVLSLNLRARGTLADPQVDLNAGVQNIGLSQIGLGQARLHYTYGDARSVFNALLSAPKGGTLVAKGEAKQDLSLPALRRGVDFSRMPLEVDVDAHQFELSFLSGSQLPMVRSIGGVLRMEKVHVGGTVGALTYRGTLEWEKGRLALEGMGDYQDVHVALDVTDKHLFLSDLSASSGGGSLKFTAQANRTSPGAYSLTGEGTLNDFPLVFEDQLLALLRMRTQFKGEVSSEHINLRNVTIPEAHILLPEAKRKDLQPLDRPEGIVLVCNGTPMKAPRRKRTTPPPDATSPGTATGGAGPGVEDGEPQRKYTLIVNAPKNLWVQGSDVNTELGMSEDFRIEYADTTSIYGEVRVLRGEVEVLGRRLTVQNSSQVRFTGPAAMPYINATAEYDNERAGVKVFVTVRGQGKEFTIKPTSEPPLPETEIYTLLATGRRTLKAGSGASMNQEQVASVLGSALASQARKALAAKLPLDVFTIEAGEEGLAGTRLEVGTYLTDDLYLGYTGRLGAAQNQPSTRRQNNNAVRLEYQFSPQWSVEGEYGDAQQGGADVIWSKDY
ncbi:translocation/assembly module TamB domain-containing protein [Archangium lansingense]|uniref:Translocation/assembly module TamB domain-containing protein n=1 Tax=Archangium lansingense TaxID=2995310 RepID=A0ABT4AJS2_9BACT|nr:translocation/assembly module TamB domain-containing protein [Archangium lansinium]MCY1081946.1 translocation/assembly module TamB domain-containing protein [Archangium lansinium]